MEIKFNLNVVVKFPLFFVLKILSFLSSTVYRQFFSVSVFSTAAAWLYSSSYETYKP
jgi:hypothetical protein